MKKDCFEEDEFNISFALILPTLKMGLNNLTLGVPT